MDCKQGDKAQLKEISRLFNSQLELLFYTEAALERAIFDGDTVLAKVLSEQYCRYKANCQRLDLQATLYFMPSLKAEEIKVAKWELGYLYLHH